MTARLPSDYEDSLPALTSLCLCQSNKWVCTEEADWASEPVPAVSDFPCVAGGWVILSDAGLGRGGAFLKRGRGVGPRDSTSREVTGYG